MSQNKKSPILEFDGEIGIISPKDRRGEDIAAIASLKIDKCILTFKHVVDALHTHELTFNSIYSKNYYRNIIYIYNNVLVAECPIGAPSAARIMEEFKEAGVNKFIAFGTSGCLVKPDNGAEVVVINRAIRDEGLSNFYFKAGREIELNKYVIEKLIKEFELQKIKYIKGKTWTVDAIYRETPLRVARRRKEGAIVVDMECAAWAAVAKYRDLYFGQFLYFSDEFADTGWKLSKTQHTMDDLFEVAYQTLQKI